jgi:crotonobetainyl-CoA:carnitine CoA-transferase CaiB-like acyl-CoA transferase
MQAHVAHQQDGALKGIRVLDLGQFMAGPMAAMWLADFGADVIKVEHPRGDGFRHWGLTKDGAPLFWKMLSRNKRCATLNLGSPKGQDLLREMVKKNDVLIENFTLGTMKKWGVDYDSLSAINPRLIMLSISAYGQSGPYSTRPGFGTLAEALSGYAHITGQADGPPTLPGFGLADGMAGLNGAFGILLAMQHRHVSCESFNGKLRDELLNGEIFYSLKEAKIVIGQWRKHYNTIRPHSSLGYRPPAPQTMNPFLTPLDQAAQMQ